MWNTAQTFAFVTESNRNLKETFNIDAMWQSADTSTQLQLTTIQNWMVVNLSKENCFSMPPLEWITYFMLSKKHWVKRLGIYLIILYICYQFTKWIAAQYLIWAHDKIANNGTNKIKDDLWLSPTMLGNWLNGRWSGRWNWLYFIVLTNNIAPQK